MRLPFHLCLMPCPGIHPGHIIQARITACGDMAPYAQQAFSRAKIHKILETAAFSMLK